MYIAPPPRPRIQSARFEEALKRDRPGRGPSERGAAYGATRCQAFSKNMRFACDLRHISVTCPLAYCMVHSQRCNHATGSDPDRDGGQFGCSLRADRGDLFVRANWNRSETPKRLWVSLLHAQLGWSRRAKGLLRAGACSSKGLVIAQRDAAPRRPSLPVAPDAGQS
jgi:hypothetical protein